MTDLLEGVAAVNVGLGTFGAAIREQGAQALDVDWRLPAGGDPEAVAMLTRLWGRHGDRVEAANREALARIEGVRPRAVTVAPAAAVISGLEDRMLLHSGPPITWDRVCDPQRRAMTAACLFEGWAADRPGGEAMLAAGEIALRPGNEHGHVGAMTGICSPSMPVWVVEDEAAGVRAFSTLNEGPGNTLWFGVGDDEAVERLRFFRDEAGPLLARLLDREGPVDVFALAAQALQMGDELHMRSQAAGALLLRTLAGGLVALGGESAGASRERAGVGGPRAGVGGESAGAGGESGGGGGERAGPGDERPAGSGERVARFVAGNHHVFLPLTMAAAKCASLAAAGTDASSLVVLIARNGTDVGVQLAGLPGRWFTAPAATVQDALLREGFTEADAARDIGDSAVIECAGLGGMAVAASPVVAAFFGGSAADAVARTQLMAEICVGRSQRFTIPSLDGAGTPVGIDARLVVEVGITPQITTGVLHASTGAGQIGAGLAHQPPGPFRDACAALAGTLDAAARGQTA